MDQADEALFEENARLAMADEPEIAMLGPFDTDSGGHIPELEIAFQTFGEFNRSNAILICHALTGTSNVLGWWGRLAGPGKPIDTDKYFVIGNNLLGGCQGSTGPSSLAPDGRIWGSRFPILTVEDQVRAQELLLRSLKIEGLHAVIGCSTGGFHALRWAQQHPIPVAKVAVTASGPRQNALQLALNEAGRQAVMRDPKWRGGDYPASDPPKDGLAVARMIGHIAYLSGAALEQKFGRKPQRDAVSLSFGPEFAVESYLNYQGDKFNERFDANSYLHLTRAANFFDLRSLEGAQSEFLFVSFTSDTLYPPELAEELKRLAQAAGCKAEVAVIDQPYGHDSFLLDGEGQGSAILAFLAT
ncbi:MAG: homoserine O-acetyltransferase MetX [Fimbriimonadales bacterium]